MRFLPNVRPGLDVLSFDCVVDCFWGFVSWVVWGVRRLARGPRGALGAGRPGVGRVWYLDVVSTVRVASLGWPLAGWTWRCLVVPVAHGVELGRPVVETVGPFCSCSGAVGPSC